MKGLLKKMKKKKIPVWKKLLLVFESLLIVAYLFVTVFFVWFKVDKNGFVSYFSANPLVRWYLNKNAGSSYAEKVQDKDYDKDKVVINDNLSGNVETYKNIAIFGIDSRGNEFDNSANSDTIIIVSINNKTGQVKMASVFRDTMLKIVDDKGKTTYFKANSAFFRAGPECAVNMLNTNLDMNITDYVVVNFNGVAQIIDALGGVDVNITEDERFYINGYLVETRLITGMDAPDIETTGPVHLTGLQATAFCRIRYVTFTDEDGTKYDNDMGRTARQRYIIRKLIDKAKTAGVSQLLDVVNKVFSYNKPDEKIIGSSLSFNEILDMVPTLINFTLVGNTGFPYTVAMPTINGVSMVVAGGLSYNVTKLHEFLFDDIGYKPSSTVNEISDYLESYTGVPTVRKPEDKQNSTYDKNSDQTGNNVTDNITDDSN